jgi:hypothetical protein
LAQGSEVAAEELPPLPLIGNKPRVLALCDVHRKEVYEPLVEMVKEFGQIVDIDGTAATAPKRSASRSSSPAPSSDALWCPECEAAGTPRSFTAPQGLGAHRYRAHGVESPTKQQAKAG